MSSRQVPSMSVPRTVLSWSTVPEVPSSPTDLASVVVLPSSSVSARELGSSTVVPCFRVVLSTSSTEEVPPFEVLCRWTTITSRFWAPTAVAVPAFEPDEETPGSFPADQR